jgi:HCOMODA/2-hydroxy-3-carboxy-muconic semialdehyde decarboxylase
MFRDIELNRQRFMRACAIGFAGACLPSWVARAQSVSASRPDPKLIEDLVSANCILALQGVVDAYGHVSARHDQNPSRYLLSRSLAPEFVSADDIMEYDLDSNPVDAKGRPSYLERFIHGEVYRKRPDIKAVVHCHTPSLIPFAVTDVPLRPVFGLAGFIAEGIPVFDTRKVAGMTDLLVRNATLGRALAQTLGNKPASLMRGHGAVVVGPSLPIAVGRSVYLAMNASLQAQAMALGGKITYLDPEEGRQSAADGYQRAWELWKRKVGK